MITRTGDGYTCTASQSFLRENGTGAIVLDASVGRLTILSAREVSAECKISKTKRAENTAPQRK